MRIKKRERYQSSEQILDFFSARLVTVEETCLYHYDLETKQQSMEWRHSGSPHPKKFRVQKYAGKVLACLDVWGSRRHHPQLLSSKGPNYQRGI
jgi:hypothetical protein